MRACGVCRKAVPEDLEGVQARFAGMIADPVAMVGGGGVGCRQT